MMLVVHSLTSFLCGFFFSFICNKQKMKTKHRNIIFTSQQNLTLTNCKSICKTFANCNKKKKWMKYHLSQVLDVIINQLLSFIISLSQTTKRMTQRNFIDCSGKHFHIHYIIWKHAKKIQSHLFYISVLIYWNKYLVHQNFKVITQNPVHHKIL